MVRAERSSRKEPLATLAGKGGVFVESAPWRYLLASESDRRGEGLLGGT
jgi:hypothetical protein